MKEDLTLFILSTGNNPNFEDCVLALKNQTMLAKIDIISEYAPLSLASQEMINRCTTKYYIQVDEDMILNADSVEKMYNAIDRSDEKTSMIAFMLHDTHLDFNICGIKIYKHKIFKKFPYNLNIISCEMEQLNRMKEEGYRYETFSEVVGEHSPKWSDELIFERYFDLMEKWKLYKYDWLNELPSKLFVIFKNNSTNINFYAMMGAICSIVKEDRIRDREKNFKITDENYERIKKWIK